MPVTFSGGSTTSYPSPASGGRMLFIDADGDGDEDILYQTGANGSAWAYAQSEGNGFYTVMTLAASPFASLTSIPDDVTGSSFHVLDYDGDGDMDIWAASPNFTTGSLYRNNGNSSFTSVSSGGMPTAGAGSRVITGDFDNDGDDDILYQTNANGSAFQYGRSNGDGSYTILSQAASPFAAFTLTDNTGNTHHVGDFDGDGDDDIWMAVNGATGTFLRNDGNGVFSSQSTISFPAPAAASRVVVGDFDSDGDDDILYQTGGNGTAFQYAQSNGDGTFTLMSLAVSPFAGASLPLPDHQGPTSNYVAADVDGDGDLDLVIGVNGTQGQVYIASGAPPRLAASTPSDNGTGAAVGANITLTFNESVSKGAGNIYIYRGDGTLIETISVGSAQVTGSGTTWTIDPSVTLQGNTNYYVRTDRGVFRDTDGSIFFGITNSTTLNFTTAAANTAPFFTNLNGDSAAHTENVPVRLDVGSNTFVSDADSANFDTGTLTVSISANGQSGQDVLSIANIGVGAGAIAISGSAVFYSGVQFGTFTGGTGGTNLVITFDADATPAAVQALVRCLQYNNTSNAPNTATRTISYVLTDGDGGTSATQTTFVNLTTVNDAPSITDGGGTFSTNEQTLVRILPSATLVDPELMALNGGLGNYAGASFTVSRAGGANADDSFGFSGGYITLNGLNLQVGGLTFATISGSPGQLTINFTSEQMNATYAVVNETIRRIAYANTNNVPPGSVNLAYQFNDGGASGAQGSGGSLVADGSVTVNISALNDVHTGGASVSGTATEDQVLTAVSTMSDPDGIGTLHYQWQRDTGSGYVNVGTDQATYTLGDADVGGTIRVVIYYTDAGGTVESSTSAGTTAIAGVNDPHTGGASITGTTTEDQTLTAVSTLADTDGLGTLRYDWQRDTGSGFVSIGAADQATYTLGDADVGASVRVVISYTDGQGFTESATSGGTGAITAIDDAPTGGVSVTGTTTEDQVLTADTSSLADADGLGTLHYDWQRDTGSGFVSIGAADQATYTLGDADVGASIRVVVSYTDDQGFSNSVTSAGSSPITNVNDAPTGGVSITGTATEDQVLTADTSTLADADGLGTLHYIWQRDDGMGFYNVGADQATYTLGDDDVGATIRVIVSWTDGHGASQFVISSATSAIVNVDDAPVAQNDAVSTVESAPVSGDLFADNGSGADSDVDGPALTIAAVNGSAANVGTQITLASGALLTVNADGTYTYDPNGRFNDLPGAGSGSVNTATETFTYTLANGNTATVTVTVNGEASTTGDILVGGGGDDVQTGSTGSDRIVGGAGNDTIDGGAGIDTVTFGAAQTGVIVRLNHNDVPNDGYGGTDTITGVENVTGGAFNDILIGAGGSNTLIGGGGYDVLIGLDGNDILVGGSGTANELYGGMGDDIYYISANDTVIELAGQGNDTIFTTRNVFTMPDHVERLIFNGTGDFLAVGSAQNNIISGGTGNDQLYGRGGYDVLIGGAGNDILGGGSGLANELYGGEGDDTYLVDANDSIVELAGQGIDTIRTTIGSYNLGANVENLNYIGTSDFVGRGNELDNIITGRWGDDILTGGGGNDTLNGGDGRDTAVLSGVAGDYSFTYVTGSTWTVTDRVGGRDGVDTLINIERVAFSDGTFRILTPPPAVMPALSDKEMDQAQVLPVPGDDDFLFGKGDGGAQVLPGLTDADPLVLPVLHEQALDSLGNGGLFAPPLEIQSDAPGMTPHSHNDWLL